MDATTSRAILLIGASGSGKTTALRLLSKKAGLPVLVHGDAAEFPGAKPRLLDMSCSQLKDVTFIIDDLMSLAKQSEHQILRNMLCYVKRHNRVNVFVAVHSLNFSGVLGILPFFDVVYFTNSPSNLKDVKLLQKQSQIEDLTEAAFKAFCLRPRCYWRIDLRSKLIDIVDSQLNAVAQGEISNKSFNDIRREIMDVLRHVPERDLLVTIFDYIFRNVSPEWLSKSDYCIYLSNGATSIPVSLIDYLLALRSLEKPSHDIKCLHKYFKSQFQIPNYFVLNTELRLA